MAKRLILSIALLLAICTQAQARQEFFPFVAEVNARNVNVRAGENTNFEKISRLNEGDRVVVVEKRFSWYKIELPKVAKSYISDEFVLLHDERNGEVIGSRVNVRAGAGPEFTVLGQLKAGDSVTVTGHNAGWYQIEPLDNSHGWVNEKFLTFYSNTVDDYDPDQLVTRIEDRKEKAFYQKLKKEQKKNMPVETIVVSKGVTAEGFLSQESLTGSDIIAHKISIDGKPTYYLQGLRYILDDFLHYKVSIKGELITTEESHFSYPVIDVQEVHLIL